MPIDNKFDLDEKVMAYLSHDLFGKLIKRKVKGVVHSIQVRKPVKGAFKGKEWVYLLKGGIFYLVLFLWPTSIGEQQQEEWIHEDQISKLKRKGT